VPNNPVIYLEDIKNRFSLPMHASILIFWIKLATFYDKLRSKKTINRDIRLVRDKDNIINEEKRIQLSIAKI